MNGVSMRNGWLKLWYKIEDNPIFSDAIVLAVFTKLLLRANIADRTLLNGQRINRGQLVISQQEFADSLQIGRQQLRRALSALCELKSIQTMAAKPTRGMASGGTLITICNYSRYQDRYAEDQPAIQPTPNQRPTSVQPASNQRSTTEEEYKNTRTKELKTKNPPKSPQGELPGIPAELNVPEFLQAWEDWRKHRTEIRKPLKPTSAKRQLSMLSQMGVARAIATIEYTILKGWEGLVDPERNGSSRHTKKPTPLLPLDDGS